MAYKIDKATRDKTTRCEKCFSCLEDNGEKLCRIRQCVEGKVHFIECEDDILCAYKKTFGDSKYCDCPVRKEIFRKYNR